VVLIHLLDPYIVSIQSCSSELCNLLICWLSCMILCACFVALLMRVTLYSPKPLLHVLRLIFMSKRKKCVQPVCFTHYTKTRYHYYRCLHYLQFSLQFSISHWICVPLQLSYLIDVCPTHLPRSALHLY